MSDYKRAVYDTVWAQLTDPEWYLRNPVQWPEPPAERQTRKARIKEARRRR